ncbi:aminoglycoside phosphotransferase [Mycolicibacterium duvalii]|uniref:phosphotransferase family protein n=1 Tax=Mycolicibacterium duvalii TaxID=39688 RepID=UPI000BEEB52A|nr:phosphotransferase [Mycolicibacterium duvalii]MCV7369490.1 aminoglycoside phosphotransferase family protein [Mycolicibacterium duvalii]PEG42130.1 aminoglycoside phosphotransferase [Mycolicibacterium duvalii]
MTIPRSPEDLTAAWLGSVLGTEVSAVDVVAIGTGQTGATYRVTASYPPGDRPSTPPTTFAVKLPAQDDAVRERVALGYVSEVDFYTAIAKDVAIPAPNCFHSEISSDGKDFVLVLADMAPAVQGDQIAGCTAAEAELAVEALAGLHGPTWNERRYFDLPSIVMPKPGDEAAAGGMGEVAKMAADITLDKLGASVSDEDRDTLLAAMSLVTPWLLAVPDRFSLMHGDYRLDNLLYDPDRTRVTVVDWQTLGIGLPSRDLAYFTGTSLQPETRAAVERDLVARYHAALLGHGVTGYDLETCWHDYRLGVLQAPLITALGTAFASSTERGDEMMLTMLHRGCRAIRELDSIELVRSYEASSPTTA